MDKILIVSYGNISTLTPLFRYIIKNFVIIYNKPVLVHTSILSNNDFSDIIETIPLHRFKDNNSFYSQSSIIKIKRYLKLILILISFLKAKELKTIYTTDIEVVLLLRIISYFLNFKKYTILIYHQFEMIELDNYERIKRLLIKIALEYFKNFDLIIIPESNRIKHFIKQTNVDRSSIFLLPNTCKAASNKSNNSSNIFNFSGKDIVIGHIGNVNNVNFYLRALLDSFNKINSKKYKLLFIGKLDAATKEFIVSFKNENIIIKEFLPHNELANVYRSLDIGLILYKPHKLNEEYCAPNKLYEYLSFGIPILAPRLNGLIDIFNEDFIGYLVNFSNEEEITDSITLINNQLDTLKHKIKSTFENKYDIDIYLDKLNHLLKEITKEKNIA